MKLIVFKLGQGNWQTGFGEVKIQFWESNNSLPIQLGAILPANPQLSQLYQRWQQLYQALLKFNFCRNYQSVEIEFEEDELLQVSDQEFEQISEQLKTELNLWLNNHDYAEMEVKLRSFLHLSDEIRLVIETEQEELRRFPWHLWDFFDDYQFAEIALSPSEYAKTNVINNQHNQVRILAILGNSQGINIEQDKQFLNRLPQAEIVCLVEPSRSQFNNILWDEKGWDILFFAGHTWSVNEADKGYLALNSQNNISPSQLKNALKKAITNGLKLAIFNSCDGLGLAKQLAQLHIPQMIVMRFNVPDLVAQEFLKYFLQGFSSGKSFYVAVREARERLQGLEDKFPCASWLPVICQNPAQIPPTWRDLINQPASISGVSTSKPKLALALATSLILSLVTMAGRSLGFWQRWELKAFDFLMRHKPSQPADGRLVIIGADEDDLSNYGYPLPDQTLLALLQQLQSYQPRAIAIDIFRDRPTGLDQEQYGKLTTYLAENQDIVTVCNIGNELNQSVAPPDNLGMEQVGYADLYDDSQPTNNQDDTIRRYLLSRSSNTIATPSRCQTDYSLGWHLAYRYLISQGIDVTTVGDSWQFGEVVLKPLQNRSGGYQKLDARGNQLLINYRNTPQIAQQLTIRDVLAGEEYFNPNWIKDRIVLIGMTADSLPDFHDTPLGEIRGIYIHAHVVSQILDAVESKGKNLIWWLPQGGDFILVSFWATTGSLIIWLFPQRSYQMGALSLSMIILISGSWWAFSQSLWLPLIPSTIVLFLTVGVTETIKKFRA